MTGRRGPTPRRRCEVRRAATRPRASPQPSHLYRPAGEPDVGLNWDGVEPGTLGHAQFGPGMAVQAISGSGASSFPTGVQLPPAAALRRSHTRGRRPPPFPRDSRVSWHTVSLRQSSEHPNTFTSLRRPHASVFGCSARGARNAHMSR
jgi:hypothetical protein